LQPTSRTVPLGRGRMFESCRDTFVLGLPSAVNRLRKRCAVPMDRAAHLTHS
jgi:hypothetical protein